MCGKGCYLNGLLFVLAIKGSQILQIDARIGIKGPILSKIPLTIFTLVFRKIVIEHTNPGLYDITKGSDTFPVHWLGCWLPALSYFCTLPNKTA